MVTSKRETVPKGATNRHALPLRMRPNASRRNHRMICASCGGLVIWKGPLVNLTHTECQRCGAVNNQVADQTPEEECQELADEDPEVQAGGPGHDVR